MLQQINTNGSADEDPQSRNVNLVEDLALSRKINQSINQSIN